jgi:hypothetical protein
MSTSCIAFIGNKKGHPATGTLRSEPALILEQSQATKDALLELQDSRQQQHQQWLKQLHRLDDLQLDLALLPVGWGSECKGPMLNEWQKHPGFTIPQLQSFYGIKSVGARTGLLTGPLIAFDFDGPTASELACELGMEPWAPEAASWHVHRSNDPWRFKVFFRPTPDQIAQLPIGKSGTPEFQGKTPTAPKKDGNKGEALEVFFDGGRQAIILGNHPSTGGFYYWPQDSVQNLGPEALKAPPKAWWDHAIQVATDCQERIAKAPARSTTRKGTRKLDPCPICGRHSGKGGSSLWCEETTAGMVLCMPGSTFSAKQSHGDLSIGQVVNGYALVKRSAIPEGDVLSFKPHTPSRRSNASRTGSCRAWGRS